MPPCLTLSIIRYLSRAKWSNLGKVATVKGAFESPLTTVANFTFLLSESNELTMLCKSSSLTITPFEAAKLQSQHWGYFIVITQICWILSKGHLKSSLADQDPLKECDQMRFVFNVVIFAVHTLQSVLHWWIPFYKKKKSKKHRYDVDIEKVSTNSRIC